MPCRDYYDDHPEAYFRDITEPALKKQISFAESALCQTLSTFQEHLKNMQKDYDDNIYTNPLDYLDYEAAGITREELEKWWDDHQALDKEHRERARQAQVKRVALAKLTPEERKVLGL